MGKIFNCNDVDFHRPMNFINGAKYFKIGSGTYFGKFCALTAWDNFLGVLYNPKIVIGTECGFNDYLHLTCINQIIIGNNVRCGRWVTISDNNHGKIDVDNLRLPPNKRILYSKGPIIIENRVWIGDKTTILGGVHIGEGSVIGANSVVTKDIPAYCVAVGNPAKVIKKITTLNE